MQNVLLVVAKQPAPGQTKTRLCPPLNSTQAAELYECFLYDTLKIMRSVPEVIQKIVYLPREAQDYFRHLAPDMGLIQQRGESLGERLDNLLQDVLQQGADKAVVINSDSPTLPPEYLIQAFEQLSAADVVLGPAQDGGYYLIGMKEPHPGLLRNVQMSTQNVLQDTLDLARRTGVSTSLLPEWYDVDTIDDLHRLKNDINGQKNTTCPHTSSWLQRYPGPAMLEISG
jgi:rSAM/selenodomain-associated transferase 1